MYALCVKKRAKLCLCVCQIKLLDGASVFVRLCDARREDELMFDVPSSKLVSHSVVALPVTKLHKTQTL